MFTSMSLILTAARYAALAHTGQTRKYGGGPFILHPTRVGARLSYHESANEVIVAAAMNHDVIEDCAGYTEVGMATTLGAEVAGIVGWLTNPSKDRRDLNRAARKTMDRLHIARAPYEARLIKLADRADNLRDMTNAPTSFLRVYVPESQALLEVLRGTDEVLEHEFADALADLVGLLAHYKESGL